MSPLIIDNPSVTKTSSRRAAHRRRFTIESAKFKDVRRLVQIEFRAFEHEKANHVLSYRDYKQPAHVDRTVSLYAAAINRAQQQQAANLTRSASSAEDVIAGVQNQPSVFRVGFRKVVDVESHEAISFAKVEWKAYEPEELVQSAEIGHESEARMNRDWFALNERLRREYVGTVPHCYIGMLATEPQHQHHGAGTMLLEEILAEADDAGVEVYLEATDTARPLYERHGFVPVHELRFNPAEYGVRGVGIERQTVMVRAALGEDGRRGDVRAFDEEGVVGLPPRAGL